MQNNVPARQEPTEYLRTLSMHGIDPFSGSGTTSLGDKNVRAESL